MVRYERPQTAFAIALHRGLCLAIIMDRYEVTHNALTIALHGGFYLAIIMDRYESHNTALYYSLAWRPLPSHYKGPL
jgi:hypothetical protein